MDELSALLKRLEEKGYVFVKLHNHTTLDRWKIETQMKNGGLVIELGSSPLEATRKALEAIDEMP